MRDKIPGSIQNPGGSPHDPSSTAAMQGLFDRQLAEATRADGSVDFGALSKAVADCYGRTDNQGQDDRLRAVLENMAQGVCLFDGKQRLLVCNQRYAEVYGLRTGQVQPGTTLREILERRHAAGSTPAMTSAAYLVWRDEVALLNKPHTSTVELQNGRAIAIRHQPMPGGGWVATHEDVTDRLKTERDLTYLERHFATTGLPNRTLVTEQLGKALLRASRTAPCAVLSLSLDGLPAINNTLGRPAGNVLLRVVAEQVRSRLRPGDLLGQLDASEFVIVQSDVSQPGEATRLARQLLDLLAGPVALAGQSLVVGASVGIALAFGEELDAEVLLHNASVAMHGAQMDGGGLLRLFEPEMDARLKARRLLETDLRDAVNRMAFELHYQPQFDLKTRRITGFEALLRWAHPVRGAVPPSVFIPVAEEIGLIGRIGQWTLQQACMDARGWPDDISVAVNVSALQLRDDSLPSIVADALGHSKLLPSRLELEITETSMMADPSAAAAVLAQVRGSGVKVALDDFGTGYSSLSYLPSLPFDKLKVDRSFIAKLGEGAVHTAIIRAIISLCASLGVTCIAEGVETEAQLAVLASENCTEVQGHLLGGPSPAQDIPELLRRSASQQPNRVGAKPGKQAEFPLLSQSDENFIPFRQIIETANDAVIVTEASLDPPGPRILYVNPAFSRLSGYSAQEAIGLSPRILQGPGTSRTTLDALAADLRAGRETRQKVLNYAKCGAPYWLDLRIVPLLRDGRVAQFAAIERDVTLDKRRLDELEYVADRDALTGIPNRRALLRTTDAELQAARSRRGTGPCLAYIDVDHFKRINDRFGHATGDAVLFGIADRLAENVRRVDMVGRVGGEEFAACMPSITLPEAAAIGERLRRAVAAEPFDTPEGPLHVTVSIGVSETGRDEHSLSDLMARADRAMYVAKRSGRDRVATEPALSRSVS